MEKRFRFAGSILSADLLNLEREVASAVEQGIDLIHFDVMDYHFVPNMTFGPGFLKAMRQKFPDVIFDVHLMVSPLTEQIVTDYAKAGASWISIHPESTPHVERFLTLIKDSGAKAGLVLNPSTTPNMLRYLWDKIDFVLIMTVNPGFGGQKLIPATLKKIADVKRLATEANVKPVIEVDGGISPETVAVAASYGASVFVVGNAFFGQKDRALALLNLHKALE